MNQLEIFDNYVILYYDKDGKIYKETKEKSKKEKTLFYLVLLLVLINYIMLRIGKMNIVI